MISECMHCVWGPTLQFIYHNHNAKPALTIPLAICHPKQVKLLRCGSMSSACVTGEGEPEPSPLSSPVESLSYKLVMQNNYLPLHMHSNIQICTLCASVNC